MLTTSSFAEISQRYRVILFDAFGVLKNSQGVIQGVPDVLAWLASGGKELYVVTNDASKSPAELARAYVHPKHGELISSSRVISSGLLAKDYLRSRFKGGNVAYLGRPSAAFYIEAAGMEAIPIGSCTVEDDPKALVLLDDEGYDWFRDINRAINLLRKINIPVVVANVDTSYPVNSSDVAIAVGGLAMMIEGIVKKTFIRFGKPDTMVFSHAFACAHANHSDLTKADVLMVGDTLHTDILGANTFGLDTALVLSGNTQPEHASVEIASSGIIPTYVCNSILT